MRILLVHQYHPNALGRYIAEALGHLGHRVEWIGESAFWGHPGYQPDIDLVGLLGSRAKEFDLAIATDDNWLPSVMRGWERLPFPTIFISYDYQHNPRCFDPLLPLFDHIFLLNLDPVEHVAGKHPSVHWCPPAIDPGVFPILDAERIYDVGMVGSTQPTYPRRVKRLSQISLRYKTNDIQRYYKKEEIGEVYFRSKIVVNLMPDGVKTLSYRIFEGMACGALVLCEETDSGLDKLFKRGEHLLVFRDDDEMFSLIDYYLAHPEERARIARAGQELVRTEYIWDRRVEAMLKAVNDSENILKAPARRMNEAQIRRLYAFAYSRRSKFDPFFELFGQGIPPLWAWLLVVRMLISKLRLGGRLRSALVALR